MTPIDSNVAALAGKGTSPLRVGSVGVEEEGIVPTNNSPSIIAIATIIPNNSSTPPSSTRVDNRLLLPHHLLPAHLHNRHNSRTGVVGMVDGDHRAQAVGIIVNNRNPKTTLLLLLLLLLLRLLVVNDDRS